MSRYQQCYIPLSSTCVKSCRCYGEYWKSLKAKNVEYVEFDYSIEKAFSYRKYFEEDAILYHFCINCLHEIAVTIPITVINFEIYLRKRGLCIHKFKNNALTLGDVCGKCVNLIIDRFSSEFFIDV